MAAANTKHTNIQKYNNICCLFICVIFLRVCVEFRRTSLLFFRKSAYRGCSRGFQLSLYVTDPFVASVSKGEQIQCCL